jgi:hypothetical protein
LSKWIAILGCLFLSLCIVDFFSLYAPLISLLQQIVMFNEPGDPKIIAGTISTAIVSQLISSVFYIVPLTLCSVASFKFKVNAKWYKVILRVFGVVLLLTPVINSVIGIYILYLGFRKTV